MFETIKKAIKKTVKSIAKGFRPETLDKAITLLNDDIKTYTDHIKAYNGLGYALSVSVSKGNRKIGHVLNVSLAPVLTCGCMASHCKHFCYDIKAVLQYKNVLHARARNTALAMYDPISYFTQIRQILNRRKKDFYFRWHVGGDILNARYFAEMVQIAKEYPEFTFWTYTKKYGIVNDYIRLNGSLPQNLTVMFSQWKVKNENGNITAIPFQNPYNLPIFTVRFDEEQAPKLYKCPGNCDICKQLNRGCIAGESTYNDAH